MPPDLIHAIPIYLGIAAVLVGIGRMLRKQDEHHEEIKRIPALHDRVTKIETRHEMEDRAADRAA
jgi:hypothetical protein